MNHSVPTTNRRMSAYNVAKQVFALTPPLRAITVSMIFIGIAAGLAEMVGITFLVSLIFLIAQDPQNSQSAYAWVPHYLAIAGFEPSKAIVLVVLIGAILAKLLLSLTDALLVSSVSERISEHIRRKIYDRLLEIPFRDIHTWDRGELITILATESYTVAEAHKSIVRIGVNVGTLVIFGAALVGTSWQIAIIALFAGIAHTLLMKVFSKPYSRVGAAVSSALERLTRLEWTTLQTLKAVRSYGLEPQQRKMFGELSHEVRSLRLRSDQLGHVTSVLSETLIFFVLLMVMVLSGYLGLPFPAVLAATVLIYRIQPHIRELDLQLLKLLEFETPVGRCKLLIEEKGVSDSVQGTGVVSTLRKGIEFKDVSYAYPGATRNCITGKNMFIPAGRKVGLIGPSGSGKTTIMNLILGLTSPVSGQLLIDGVPLSEIQRQSWTKMIAVAGQDVELMEGTIRENIMFFRDFSDEQVRRAAQMAGAEAFIEDMPGGYDERVGDEAIKLSGGQRQRIGIARAIIGQQAILLFDEATSALDEETEAEILRTILADYKDRTVLVITHRKSVIPLLDEVISLKEDYKRR